MARKVPRAGLQHLSSRHFLSSCYLDGHVTLAFEGVHTQCFRNLLNICGSLSSWHAASSDCGWRRRPSDMDVSCERIE
jgi:hypothetical protein